METTLSKNIKHLMKDRELKQEWLAQKCQVHQNTTSRWITGKSEPSATGLYRLAKAFNVSMESLMEENHDYDIQ